MSGPCLCGDPYCGRCFPGNDGGDSERAVQELMDAIYEAAWTAPQVRALHLLLPSILEVVRMVERRSFDLGREVGREEQEEKSRHVAEG